MELERLGAGCDVMSALLSTAYREAAGQCDMRCSRRLAIVFISWPVRRAFMMRTGSIQAKRVPVLPLRCLLR